MINLANVPPPEQILNLQGVDPYALNLGQDLASPEYMAPPVEEYVNPPVLAPINTDEYGNSVDEFGNMVDENEYEEVADDDPDFGAIGAGKPIKLNPDGSTTFDDGVTAHPDGSLEKSGIKFVLGPDGKVHKTPTAAAKAEKPMLLEDPYTKEKIPYVYKDGMMKEVPVEGRTKKKVERDMGKSYAGERAKRVMQSVDELSAKVGRKTAGFGSLLSIIPESKAKDFAAELDTLKANIAFGELTEMRNASKTGGALGQVSNIELALLESTLGATDPKQSPENLKKQLAKIKSSIQRWEEAKEQYANEASSTPAPTPAAPPTPAPAASEPPPLLSRPSEKDDSGFVVGEKRKSRDGTIAIYRGNNQWQVLP